MGLHFDLRNCDQTNVRKNNRLTPTVETVIWYTILVGIPTVTEQTLPLWEKRLEAYYRVSCPAPECRLTMEEIRLCIGLRTNASTKTEKEFSKYLEKLEAGYHE